MKGWWERIKSCCSRRGQWSICNILCSITDIRTRNSGNDITVKPSMRWNGRNKRQGDDCRRQGDDCKLKLPLKVLIANEWMVTQEDSNVCLECIRDATSMRIPKELIPCFIEALRIFNLYV